MTLRNYRRKKVLIIDDDILIRHLLSKMLNDEYDVLCASSVDEGEGMLEERPDIILLDIEMPGKSGIEGLKRFRAYNPLIPIIIQTGSALDVHYDDAHDLGVDAFLVKPFRFDVLKTLLNNCVSLVSAMAVGASQHAA